MQMADKPFRRGVVAVFINARSELLVGKRMRSKNAWQFPQGGIDEGESAEDALHREVFEEIGCESLLVVKRAREMIRYEFPPDLGSHLAERYRGQEQVWFLCRFAPGAGADLSRATDDEFDELTWVSAEETLAGIVQWKIAAYERGLAALGLLGDKADPHDTEEPC